MSKPLVIFLHSSRYDRVYQAVNLVATARSMSRDAYLFLFFAALGSFAAGKWDDTATLVEGRANLAEWGETLRRGFDLSNTPSLYEVLGAARRDGARVYACSTSLRMLDLAPADVEGKVDEIIGLTTMLDIAADAHPVLYL